MAVRRNLNTELRLLLLAFCFHLSSASSVDAQASLLNDAAQTNFQTNSSATTLELLSKQGADDISPESNSRLCLPPEAAETSAKLAERFHESGVLSKEDFTRMLDKVGSGLENIGSSDLLHHCGEEKSYVEIDGRRVNCSDIISECPMLEDIYKNHSSNGGLHISSLAAAIQDSVFLLTNPNCVIEYSHKGQRPPAAKVWMYGVGFVVTLLILSNLGGLMTPLIERRFFKRLLQFLVAMGAGTLIATGVLVLVPEAFHIVSVEELADDYVWKGVALLITLYCFFVAEQLLKFGMKARDAAKRAPKRQESFVVDTPNADKRVFNFHTNNDDDDNQELALSVPLNNNNNNNEKKGVRVKLPKEHGHSHFPPDPNDDEHQSVSSVAWVLMMGDLIHKIVDGVAIGAAFTENLHLGITIAISVVFEEFPHELGDVAILLHSGMPMRKALFVNSLTASASFVGLVIGILLGENTDSTRWVLAVAAGVFIYVPMADMLPEMSQHLEVKISEARNKVTREVWILMLCQCAGLLFGMGLIFLVVNFAGLIEIS